jgi:hypothetical protein
VRFVEELCAALLLAAAIILVGYGWLMHAEAQRERIVIVGGIHE